MRPMAEAAAVEITRLQMRSILADPDALLQVLTNLLSNAIKFSPPGSDVRVEAAQDGVCAVFRVIDHGRAFRLTS